MYSEKQARVGWVWKDMGDEDTVGEIYWCKTDYGRVEFLLYFSYLR